MSIPITWVFWPVFVLVCMVLARCTIVFKIVYDGRKVLPHQRRNTSKNLKTLIVAGSGGHTTEILRVTEVLRSSYSPRSYIVAQTDKMSETKINAMEKNRAHSDFNYKISFIPRSREVQQSWLSSVVSTIYSCVITFPLVWSERPDLLTGIKKVTIIYIESICRVKTMSLSGKILYYFADQFIVQWPDLKENYPLVQYMGRVV